MDEVKQVAQICKNFRQNVVKVSLLEMELQTGVNYKTISAFENGRTNNMNHLFKYFILVTEAKELEELVNEINEVMKGVKQ